MCCVCVLFMSLFVLVPVVCLFVVACVVVGVVLGVVFVFRVYLKLVWVFIVHVCDFCVWCFLLLLLLWGGVVCCWGVFA